jgi:OOP family OmpA-OmpF porin
MVKNMKKLTLGMAAFLCGGSMAMAEPMNTMNSTQDWYVSPNISAVRPDKKFGVDKTDVGGGVRFGKAIAPNADVQVGLEYGGAKDNGVRYQQYLLGVDGLYVFSREHFRPFVLAGIGAENDKRSGGGIDAHKTAPYVNAGLGFQYAFNDQMALQADYRRVHGFLHGNDFGFKNPNNDYVSVGLNISFGQH